MSKITEMNPVGPLTGSEMVEVVQFDVQNRPHNRRMDLSALFSSGKSAYELALANGFVGSETDYLASLEGKSAYETAVAHGYEGTEEEFALSLLKSAGGGAVFVVGVAPQSGTDNVGEFVYADDDKSIVTCASTTQSVRVTLLALTGHSRYRPKVTLNGQAVELSEKTDAPLFEAVVDVTLGDDNRLVAEHEDGAVWETQVLMDEPPVIQSAVFTGGYPSGQTELKENDLVTVQVVVDSPVVGYEIENSAALKAAFSSVTPTDNLIIPALSVANRGTSTTVHGFRVRVQKANGAWSAWFDSASVGSTDGVHRMRLNNQYPVITFGAIAYPAGQEALKGTQGATVNHTVTHFDTINYASSQLTITNSNSYEAAKTVVRNTGSYNVSSNNFNITATRSANGAVSQQGIVVKIADALPAITLTTPATRLRSGGNAGTSAQLHTITLTSTQALLEAPTLNAPEGTWADPAFTPNAARTVWTRRLRVHDDDAKGTFSWNSLVAKGLSGELQTTISNGTDYTLGGFVFRTLTVPAFPNREVVIGTEVVNVAKLRCSNLSKGASGSLNVSYQADVTNAVDRFTITGPSGVANPNGTLWYNADGGNASSNTAGTMQIELEEVV